MRYLNTTISPWSKLRCVKVVFIQEDTKRANSKFKCSTPTHWWSQLIWHKKYETLWQIHCPKYCIAMRTNVCVTYICIHLCVREDSICGLICKRMIHWFKNNNILEPAHGCCCSNMEPTCWLSFSRKAPQTASLLSLSVILWVSLEFCFYF